MTKELPALSSEEISKFWASVLVGAETECWIFTGFRNESDYGMFGVSRNGKWQRYRAHRLSYLIASGEDPAEYQVIHSCDTPPCVNPAHLRKATNAENVRDMIAKGRNPHGDTHWARRMPDRVLRGEANGSAKLTAEGVREIRRRWDNRGNEPVSMYRLAKEYGLSNGYVKRLVERQSWVHL